MTAFWIIRTNASDLGAIRFSFDYDNDLTLSFRAYEVGQISIKGGPMEWAIGEPCYQLAHWDEIDPDIQGTVKWDGCINWSAGQYCEVHGCGFSEHMADLSAMFAIVYAMGAKHMPKWCGEPAPTLADDVIEFGAADGE